MMLHDLEPEEVEGLITLWWLFSSRMVAEVLGAEEPAARELLDELVERGTLHCWRQKPGLPAVYYRARPGPESPS